MILHSMHVNPDEFEARTGWSILPQGACKGDVCVPLPPDAGRELRADMLAERLGMPLLHDEASDLWCLGPASGGKALTSARAPDLALPDLQGQLFELRSLRGTKVLLLAWASW